MKKELKTILIGVVIIGIMCAFMIITGGKNLDVTLKEFTLNEDGTIMDVNVEAEEGNVRTIGLEADGEKLYVTFYSTFGLNSQSGAANIFPLEITSEYEEIYFCDKDAEDGYKLVIQKNAETGEWESVEEN